MLLSQNEQFWLFLALVVNYVKFHLTIYNEKWLKSKYQINVSFNLSVVISRMEIVLWQCSVLYQAGLLT